ncbi:MAG TPA: hypothetical protein VE890_13610 [Thermoguttaceae bacterium]|nr:hypothetical protein [Thermoguttaceae bacterium]
MNDTNPLKSVSGPAVMLLVHCIVGCGLWALLVYVVPRCMGIFADFDAELPTMTQWLILLATIMIHHWYWILGPAIAVDAVVFFGLSQLRSGKRWAPAVWFVAVLGAMLLPFSYRCRPFSRV